MIKNDNDCILILKNLLKKIDYKFILRNLINKYNIKIFNDFSVMEFYINQLHISNKEIFKFLCVGKKIDKNDLLKYITEVEYKSLLNSEFILENNAVVQTNNLVVVIYNNLFILSEIPPQYKNCINKNTEIYIGPDSIELSKNIEFTKNSTVLDLCSGTGIQGMIAAKYSKKVIAVEINKKAKKILETNIKLNDLEDVMEVVSGDLYSKIGNKTFDYIYVNPPFMPIPKNLNFPICGDGGEDGLQIIKKILLNLNKFLNENGTFIMFCQCLGQNDNLFLNNLLNRISSDFKFSITNIIYSRILWKYYIELFTDYIFNYNELDLDKNYVKYNFLNLGYNEKNTYFYTVLCKIEKNHTCNIKTIDLYNKWNIDDRATVLINKKNLLVINNQYYLEINKKRILVNKEIVDIIKYIEKGYTIDEISSELYEKYKNKYIKFGISRFTQRILDLYVELEKISVIKKY